MFYSSNKFVQSIMLKIVLLLIIYLAGVQTAEALENTDPYYPRSKPSENVSYMSVSENRSLDLSSPFKEQNETFNKASPLYQCHSEDELLMSYKCIQGKMLKIVDNLIKVKTIHLLGKSISLVRISEEGEETFPCEDEDLNDVLDYKIQWYLRDHALRFLLPRWLYVVSENGSTLAHVRSDFVDIKLHRTEEEGRSLTRRRHHHRRRRPLRNMMTGMLGTMMKMGMLAHAMLAPLMMAGMAIKGMMLGGMSIVMTLMMLVAGLKDKNTSHWGS